MSSNTAAAPSLPRLLTAAEVADQTGLPLSRVYALARGGDLPCVRFGRAMRFDPEAVRDRLRNGNGG